MTVAEMLFIIAKMVVKRAYFDDVISDEEYFKYDKRFRKIEEEEASQLEEDK